MTCEDPKVVDLITGYKNFFYIDNKSLFMKRKEIMYSALVTKTNKSKRRTNRHKEIRNWNTLHEPPNTRPFKGLTPIITTWTKPIIKIINGEGSKSPQCYKS